LVKEVVVSHLPLERLAHGPINLK